MGVHALVHKVLRDIGVDERRYNLKWASAAEAPRFVKLITEFSAQVRELGPLGHSEGIAPEEIKARLEKALEAVSSLKVRTAFGTTTRSLRKDNVLDGKVIAQTVEEKLEKSLAAALG
jgi:hypothetical protein